jgi:hypothetical protein
VSFQRWVANPLVPLKSKGLAEMQGKGMLFEYQLPPAGIAMNARALISDGVFD